MEQIPCVHCGTFFIPRNRKQNYCPQPACQRARKAAWQRYKIKTDADYRTQQKLSHQKWVGNSAGYWKRYRQRHPDKREVLLTIEKGEKQLLSDGKLCFILKIDALVSG